MKNWYSCNLGEIATFKNGKSSPLRGYDNKFPVFGSNGIIGFSDDYNANNGTIVIGRVGSFCGSIYYYDRHCWVTDNAIIGKSKKNSDSKFLYYLLNNIGLNNYRSGSGQPLLNQRTLNEIEIIVPQLNEQKLIASIISSLDDKIELNRKMNQTLEQIAQTIFKHWFIDFEFPNEEGKPYKSSGGEMVDSELGEVPKIWKIGSFSDEFKIIMGQSPPGETYNEIGNGIQFFQGRTDFGNRFPIQRVFCTEPKRIAEKFDTLLSVRAPIGDLNMASEKCCIGRGLAAIRSIYKSYAYYKTSSLKPIFKIFEAEGTVFGALTKNHFLNLQTIIPSTDIVKKFEKHIWPIDNQIYNLSKQIDTLANLKNLILPKLISGKIRVKTDESNLY